MSRVTTKKVSIKESTRRSSRDVASIKRKATKLASDLLEEYNLPFWTFGFNTNKSRLGVCRYRKKSVEVSAFFIKWGIPWDKLQDTIRHEVAHAVANARYGATGHGRDWKSVAIELGASPTSRGDSQTILPDSAFRWIVQCDSCNSRVRYHRKPKVAKYPNRYRCKCHGSFKVVQDPTV